MRRDGHDPSLNSRWGKLRREKTSSEVEGYRVALDAIRALHLGSVRGDMTFLSSTPGKIKKPESLGEPRSARTIFFTSTPIVANLRVQKSGESPRSYDVL